MIAPTGLAIRPRIDRRAGASGPANPTLTGVRHHVDLVMSASAPLAVFLVEEISFLIALAISSSPSTRRDDLVVLPPWVDPTVVVLLTAARILRHVRWPDYLHLECGRHVVLANEMPALNALYEPSAQLCVAEESRLLLTTVAVDLSITPEISRLVIILVEDSVLNPLILAADAEHDRLRWSRSSGVETLAGLILPSTAT